MIRLGGQLNRLNAYAQLSMWERQVLKIWIEEHVDLHMIWEYTSLGIADSFRSSPLGFAITHGQLQQAMLNSGYALYAAEGDIWIFNAPTHLHADMEDA